MLIALDNIGNRITPEKGAIGYCQKCKEKVRAYCGEIQIHHWRHIGLENCDDWKENESEWHRQWKKEFPKEWREVIVTDGINIHFADIKTSKGLVLELQNSSISSTTIKKREKFYGNMIWLINGNRFKDNFKNWSVVYVSLKDLERSYYSTIGLKPKKSKELKSAKQKVNALEQKIRDNENEFSYLKARKKECQEFNIKKEVNNFISFEYSYSSILSNFSTSLSDKYEETINSLKKINNELKKNKELVIYINSLKNCEFQGYENYKYIKPSEINSSSYLKCILIKNETQNTLFPTILTPKSETEFKQIAYNKKYSLAVNPENILSRKRKRIKNIETEITVLNLKKTEIVDRYSNLLKEYLANLNQKFKKEIKDILEVNYSLNMELIEAHRNMEIIEDKDNQRNVQIKMENEKFYEKDRVRIMKQYKGLRYYRWKYKRKSWNFSNKKLFLEIDDYILEIISENTVRKITKDEFIKKIINWNE